MLEATIVDLVSPSAWSAAPLILSYPQAARPITPSSRHVWTAPRWRGFSSIFCLSVGAAMCAACWCGTQRPLAIMPSAETGPDQKHALEALWREWVFPLSVSTEVYITLLLPFPNCFRRCRP